MTMTSQFVFRLMGADAPAGELDADVLVELVSSLKTVATKVSRFETGAGQNGRLPARTQKVSKLSIGLGAGSTKLTFHRVREPESLDFETAEEEAFDRRLTELVGSLAEDSRPTWADESIGASMRNLISALSAAAPKVEFSADGKEICTFAPTSVNGDLWAQNDLEEDDLAHFIGRLYSANRNTHHYRVEDAVANQISLPSVRDDARMGAMLDRTVIAFGRPRYGPSGNIVALEDSSVELAPDDIDLDGAGNVVTLEEIMESAPGPDLDNGIDLSDDELAEFLEAALQ